MPTIDDGHRRSDRLRLGVIALTAAMALVIVLSAPADAALVSKQWSARFGSNGTNGTATAKLFTTGAGQLAISLKRLAKATAYTETVYRGTCRNRGARLFALPSFRTSSNGTISRTNNLTVAQARTLTSGSFIVRFVAGSRVLCGNFAAMRIATPPTTPPASGSPSATPSQERPPVVAATIQVGRFPIGIAADSTGTYVTNWFDSTMSRIDPATNQPALVGSVFIPGNAGPQAVVAGNGAFWFTTVAYNDDGSATVPGAAYRLDPVTGTLGSPIPVGRNAFAIAVGEGAVWVANFDDDTVTRIDLATLAPTTITVGDQPLGVAAGLGSAWVVHLNGEVRRLDPVTGQVTATIATRPSGASVVIAGGFAWVTNPGFASVPNGTLVKIDPATNTVVNLVPLGSGPWPIAADGTYLWIGMLGENVVNRVRMSDLVVTAVPVSNPVNAISAHGGAVWALHRPVSPDEPSTIPAPGTVFRINT